MDFPLTKVLFMSYKFIKSNHPNVKYDRVKIYVKDFFSVVLLSKSSIIRFIYETWIYYACNIDDLLIKSCCKVILYMMWLRWRKTKNKKEMIVVVAVEEGYQESTNKCIKKCTYILFVGVKWSTHETFLIAFWARTQKQMHEIYFVSFLT